MSAAARKCVFCENDISTEEVVAFTDETLTESKRIHSIRAQFHLKFHKIKLPTAVNSDVGYHALCYKNFSTLHKKYHELKEEPKKKYLVKMIQKPGPAVDNVTNVNKNPEGELKQCFICDRQQRCTIKCIERTNEKDFIRSKVQEWAEILNDSEMLEKLESFEGNEISYHEYCKTNYESKTKPASRSSRRKSIWNSKKDFRVETYKNINKFITTNVINGEKCYLLSTLCKFYDHMVNQLFYAHGESYQTEISVHLLEENIKKAFENNVAISSVLKKRIIAPRRVTVTRKMVPKLEEQDTLLRAALIIREKILYNEGKNLPKSAHPTSIQHDKNLAILPEIEEFFRIVMCGTYLSCKGNAYCENQSQLLSKDIFKKVVNNVSCYGYCCNSGSQDTDNDEIDNLITEVLKKNKLTSETTANCEAKSKIFNGNNPLAIILGKGKISINTSEEIESSIKSKDEKEAELPIKKRTCDINILNDDNVKFDVVKKNDVDTDSEPLKKKKKCLEDSVRREERVTEETAL